MASNRGRVAVHMMNGKKMPKAAGAPKGRGCRTIREKAPVCGRACLPWMHKKDKEIAILPLTFAKMRV